MAKAKLRTRNPFPRETLAKAGFYKNCRLFIENEHTFRPITELSEMVHKASVVCLVGAGPSLDKNVELIKYLPKDSLVFASDGAIPTLARLYTETGIAGYIPELCCSCEIDGPHFIRPERITSEKIFTRMPIELLNTMKDVPMICPPHGKLHSHPSMALQDPIFLHQL